MFVLGFINLCPRHSRLLFKNIDVNLHLVSSLLKVIVIISSTHCIPISFADAEHQNDMGDKQLDFNGFSHFSTLVHVYKKNMWKATSITPLILVFAVSCAPPCKSIRLPTE